MKDLFFHVRALVSVLILKFFLLRNFSRSRFETSELVFVTKHVKRSRHLIINDVIFAERLSNCFSPLDLQTGQSSVEGFSELDDLLNGIDHSIKFSKLPRVH